MQIRTNGNTLIVAITGDMDHYNVGPMRSAIDKEIREKPIKNLVFDLSNLDFMDSSGIGLILGRYKRIREMEGKVFIAAAKPEVERVINLSGLHKIIPLYETMEKAEKRVCGVIK
ncbi:MAG: anti-sigma F factor antagonist [Clostridia bacterium]|nr:anti-sigma F factor antagonist [Clostridia bacterium]